MRKILFLLLLLAIQALLLAEEPVREWKSTIGRTMIEASLDVTRNSDPKTVYFIKEGKRYKIPFEKLSQADQKYVIKAWEASRGQNKAVGQEEVSEMENSRGMAVVPSGKRYALLIGVNEYEEVQELKCCVNDMKALKNALLKIGFQENDIQILVTGGGYRFLPTKKKIEQKLSEIFSAAQPEDMIFIAFSGHGAQEEEKVYFCPPETSMADLEGTCVSITKMMDDLSKCPAKFKLVVVDACRNKPTRDGKGLLTVPPPPAGIALFQSCAKGELSYEESRVDGNGYFTKNFVAALSGEADSNHDGKLTLMEVCTWTADQTQVQVQQAHHKIQRPSISASITNFALTEDLNVPKAKALAEEAQKAMDARNYSLAIEKFNAAIALCPRLESSWKRERELAKELMEKPQNSSSIQSGAIELLNVNGVTFPFRYCPPGSFMMGSPESEEGRNDNEIPHRVTLSKGFWMMQTEVTQKQWKAVMGNNPSHFKGDSLPVETVSWNDCHDFCKKCSLLGLPVRLPTEAQWEYACRAASSTAFSWGNDLNGDNANCDGSQPYGTTNKGAKLEKSAPAESYKYNKWNLYDMHGNVWEWCDDGFESYPDFDVTDPFSGKNRAKFCMRGGGWNSSARDCRSASRGQRVPDYRSDDLGFRVVLSEEDLEDYKKKEKVQKPVLNKEQPKAHKDILIEPPLTWSMNSIFIEWNEGTEYIYGIDPNYKESLNIIKDINIFDDFKTNNANYKNHSNPLSLFGIVGSKVSAAFYIEGESNYYPRKSYSATQWSEVEKELIKPVWEFVFEKSNSDQRLIFTIDFVNHSGSRLDFSSSSVNTIPVFCGNVQIGVARLISKDKSIAATGKPISFQFEMTLNERGKQLLVHSRPRIRMEDSQLKIQSLSTASKRIEDAIQESTAAANYFTVAILAGNEVKEWKIRWFKDNPVTLQDALEAINERVCEDNNNNLPMFDIKGGRILSVCKVLFTENKSSDWIAELKANDKKVDANSCLTKTPGRGDRYVFQLVTQEIKTLQKKGKAGDADATFELSKRYDNGDGTPEDKILALSALQKAAEMGSAEAQWRLSMCYFMGIGVPFNDSDDSESVKWFRKAAENGNAEAQYHLGKRYYEGLNLSEIPQRIEIRVDYTEAAKWFRKAADQGFVPAQFALGDCYQKGEGVSQDYSEAVKWYRKAADQGHTEAQYALGSCYRDGLGVTKNMVEAATLYRKAAEQGYAEAQNALGACYQIGGGVSQDYSAAATWYRKAAEQGYAPAQCNLGVCFQNGRGVTQDYAEAVKWFRKAADQRETRAYLELGICYYRGEGVRQDSTEAVKWYRKAAEQGEMGAQFLLGLCYGAGDGVSKDSVEAAKWLRKAADQGLADAQFRLGMCYSGGIGVTRDYAEAENWFRKAAEQGFADAQCALGGYYLLGLGVTRDTTEAVKWFRKAAEQGNVAAQNQLGECYAKGEGVRQDLTEAVRWYRKAAEQGNVFAQLDLGLLYAKGEGVRQDSTEAVKWFRKAAEQGMPAAQIYLGEFYAKGVGVPQSFTEAVKWYRTAAEKGSADAQNALGACYLVGEGVTRDPAEAVKWFRKAAEQGNVVAQFNLGRCYVRGEGVRQDYTEAVKWYRAAAEKGYAEAQSALGACYLSGIGVTRDDAEAVKWLRKAADRGVAEAQCNLGACYLGGLGVTRDPAEGVKWFRKAADQGVVVAQFDLGKCYANGDGVSQNYTEAAQWFRRAANQGFADAQCALGFCYSRGDGVPQSFTEAVKWYRKAADQGQAVAQYLLGEHYERGLGVSRDYSEAVKWYRKAARQGNKDAIEALNDLDYDY